MSNREPSLWHFKSKLKSLRRRLRGEREKKIQWGEGKKEGRDRAKRKLNYSK